MDPNQDPNLLTPVNQTPPDPATTPNSATPAADPNATPPTPTDTQSPPAPTDSPPTNAGASTGLPADQTPQEVPTNADGTPVAVPDGTPSAVQDDNSQQYGNVGAGDVLATTPDGSPIVPIPAKPTEALTITTTPTQVTQPDGTQKTVNETTYSRPIAPSDVLASQGLVEVRNPDTGMMEQFSKTEADNKIKQLANFQEALNK